jgi:hypothetical protein
MAEQLVCIRNEVFRLTSGHTIRSLISENFPMLVSSFSKIQDLHPFTLATANCENGKSTGSDRWLYPMAEYYISYYESSGSTPTTITVVQYQVSILFALKITIIHKSSLRKQIMTKITTIYYIALCSLVEVDWRFRGAYTYAVRNTHLWNVDLLQRDYAALYPSRLSSSHSPPWEPEVSQTMIHFHTRLYSQSDTIHWHVGHQAGYTWQLSVTGYTYTHEIHSIMIYGGM